MKKKSARSIISAAIILLALLSTGITVEAQDSVEYPIREGWKFHAGDDIPAENIIAPGFDDSLWTRLTLPQGGYIFPIDKTPHLWLRASFILPDELNGKMLSIYSGKIPNALEIFINGVKIGTYGATPPAFFMANPNIPVQFLIPSTILKKGEANVIVYHFYCERRRGFLKDPVIMAYSRAESMIKSDTFFGLTVPMIVTTLCIVLFFYFLILFMRNRSRRYNLFLAVGSLFIALYFLNLNIEKLAFPYVLFVKFTYSMIYLGVPFFLFYFQEFFNLHNSRRFRYGLIAVSGIAVGIIWLQSDLSATELMNDSYLQLFFVALLTLYMAFLAILAALKRRRYAVLLLAGILLVIGTSARDAIVAAGGNQPRFWSDAMGMLALITCIFLTSANTIVDTEKRLDDVAANLRVERGSFVSKVRGMTGKQLEELAVLKEKILEHSENLSTRAKDLAVSVEEISSTFEELSVSINSIAKTAKEAFQDIDKTVDRVDVGTSYMSQNTEASEALVQMTGVIKNFTSMIYDITDQTALLALNASIEAAHAGELGKGFTIVAKEIRKLSDKSSEAAKEIAATIGNANDLIYKTFEKSQQAKEIFAEISGKTRSLSEMFFNVASATNEHAKGSDEVVKTLEEISGISETTVFISGEMVQIAQRLSIVSEELLKLTGSR